MKEYDKHFFQKWKLYDKHFLSTRATSNTDVDATESLKQ